MKRRHGQAECCVYLHSNFSGELRKTFISARVTFRPFKVIRGLYFGANRKRVCDLPLVRHGNLGPILHRFRDIAGFLCP